MIPCGHLNCDGTQITCGKLSTHAYKISGFIQMDQVVNSIFISHIECRCDDHIMNSFLPGFESLEISIDEAVIRQVLDS